MNTKRTIRTITALALSLLLILPSTALASPFASYLTPSYARFAGVEADLTNTYDEYIYEIYENVTEAQFEAYGVYLAEYGYEIADATEEGAALSFDMRKDGKRIGLTYDFRLHSLEVWKYLEKAAALNNKFGTTLAAVGYHTVGLRTDGTVVWAGDRNHVIDVSGWRDIVSVAATNYKVVGLKSDGTVVVAVVPGSTRVKSDGTLVAVEDSFLSDYNVSDWRDIVSVKIGFDHIAGLKSDGTVVATGDNEYGECDVSDWRDIVSVETGYYYTVGLRRDGTVVATGLNDEGQCDVSDWQNVVAVAADDNHTIGLRSDGTVVATGNNKYGQCNTSDWTDVESILAKENCTVGLKSDGTVVATGDNEHGQCDVTGWRDIASISTGYENAIIGIKSDGSVEIAGKAWLTFFNGDEYVVEYSRLEEHSYLFGKWKEIVYASAGYTHIVGLKSDGTVVAIGLDGYGQCAAAGWWDIAIPGETPQW